MEGFEDLRRACAAWRFGSPPVPASLRPLVRAQARACWGTREVSAQDRYNLVPTLWREVAEATGDHLSLSHVGYGVNSYRVSYQLVLGPLVLFFESPWGGVYMDNAEAAGIVAERFEAAGALLAAVEAAWASAPPRSGRLVVAEWGVDWHSRGVAAWLRRPVEGLRAAETWVMDHAREEPPATALGRALALVEGAPDAPAP